MDVLVKTPEEKEPGSSPGSFQFRSLLLFQPRVLFLHHALVQLLEQRRRLAERLP